MRKLLLSFLAATFLLAAPQAMAGQTRIFALVVANNHSLDPDTADLQYADDDAARFYELMATMADHAELLVTMDETTQRRFPDLARKSRPPTKSELGEAMSRIINAIQDAKDEGYKAVFFFYFAGHGEVGRNREGSLNLQDARLSRTDLYREVIAASPADTNHLIIDACNSYFMVHQRGKKERRRAMRRALSSFLEGDNLKNYPNTGVILSTASAVESHEWSRYQSGIFSHQLLSALWGAADVDGDGAVRYDEVKAYVAAANFRVRDPRAKIKIHARAPRANARATLTKAGQINVGRKGKGGAVFMDVPADMIGHFYLEDDRGVRHMDFNKSGEQGLSVALVRRPHYFLRTAKTEALVRLADGRVDGSRLQFKPRSVSGRGSIEDSFRRDLYQVAFGKAFLAGYSAAGRSGEPEVIVVPGKLPPTVLAPWYKRAGTWKYITLGVGVVGLGTGIGTAVSALDLEADMEEPGQTLEDYIEARSEIDSVRLVSNVALGVGTALTVTSLVLFLLDGGDDAPARASGSLAPMRVKGGGGLIFSQRF